MREIALFVEDFAHQQVIGALIQRMTEEYGIAVQLHWRSTTHGYGRVVREFKEFLRDLDRQGNGLPDLIVVATDSNCKGLNERVKEIGNQDAPVQMIHAVPDPHVERWFLLKVSNNTNVSPELEFPIVTLTMAGTELYRVVQPKFRMDYLRSFSSFIQSNNCQLSGAQIVERLPGGKVKYHNFTPIEPESDQLDGTAL